MKSSIILYAAAAQLTPDHRPLHTAKGTIFVRAYERIGETPEEALGKADPMPGEILLNSLPCTVFTFSRTGLNFGEAIAALKAGKRVAREGWNGKGLFVFMQVPALISLETVPKMTSLPDSVKAEFGQRQRGIAYSNQLALVKPDNEINGWAPSTPDALAEDWMVLPDDVAPATPPLPPHQQRVLDEKAELDERLTKLGVFIKESEIFKGLPDAEQERLRNQAVAMETYSQILGARIATFMP